MNDCSVERSAWGVSLVIDGGELALLTAPNARELAAELVIVAGDMEAEAGAEPPVGELRPVERRRLGQDR